MEDKEWVTETSIQIHQGDWYEKAHDQIYCPPLEHFHTLQNLFFDLTGEEITFER